jgi:hypothetical protein
MHFNDEVTDPVCDNYVGVADETPTRALNAISRQTQDGSCESGFASHQMNPATIFYIGVTATLRGVDPLSSSPIETEGNTEEYRQGGLRPFLERAMGSLSTMPLSWALNSLRLPIGVSSQA